MLLINAKKHFTIKSHILLPWDKYKGRNETIAENMKEGSCILKYFKGNTARKAVGRA